jgi:putative peptide zinc metalloprotease protein
VVLLILGTVPVPNHFRASGVIRAEQLSELYSGTSGYLEKVHARSGQSVRRDEPLLALRNRELELDLAAAEGEAAACRAALEQTLDRGIAGLGALQDRLTSLEKQISNLKVETAALVIRAPHDGVLAAPRLEQMVGTWVQRGSELGKVIPPGEYQFSAVIPQTKADYLFTRAIRRADVRLVSDPSRTLPVRIQRIVPAQSDVLPSPALGWTAGGDVPVTTSDPRGVRAAEPFFEVRAGLQSAPADLVHHGCSGRIRFTLQPEPLLRQWTRNVRQVLQRRFQL